MLDSVYITEQTFDGMTVRAAVICGSHRALIFDTLVFPELSKELLKVCSGRELIVAYSHADWDHIWGTCGFPQSEIIAHENCEKRFLDPNDVKKTLSDYQLRYGNELSIIKLVPPTRTFQSSVIIDLGGVTVELRHCPGHTKDSIVALVPERSLLLGADCIETPIPILNEDGQNLRKWIDGLLALEHDPRLSVFVPSHGKIGGREIVRENIAYLKSLIEEGQFNIPDSLDTFYRKAHQENLEKTAEVRLQNS